MKAYISIPISGRPLHDAKRQAEYIKAKLTEHGHECITPFDVCPESGKPYAYYMGKNIEDLLADDIDAVVFGSGFHDSKGCMLEYAAAEIYGKTIVHQAWFWYLDFTTLKPYPIR